MFKNFFRKCSLILSIVLSFAFVSNSLVKNTYAQENLKGIANELSVSVDDIKLLQNGENINEALAKLQLVPLEVDSSNNKSRSLKIGDNLTLVETLTATPQKSARGETAVQIKSSVNLVNGLNISIATLTAFGYFNYNGSTARAYDGDSSLTTGAFYKGNNWVSSIGSIPVSGYAKVTCKYYVEGNLGFVWGNNILGSATITGNVFCNQDGKYYSQWA